jgi:hypothetical protein
MCGCVRTVCAKSESICCCRLITPSMRCTFEPITCNSFSCCLTVCCNAPNSCLPSAMSCRTSDKSLASRCERAAFEKDMKKLTACNCALACSQQTEQTISATYEEAEILLWFGYSDLAVNIYLIDQLLSVLHLHQS